MAQSFLSVRPRHGAVPKVVSFATLLAVAIAIVIGEIALFLLLQYATRRLEKRVERAGKIDTLTIIVPRVDESRRMIPPIIGVLYRRQTESTPPATESLFRQLLALDDARRLRLLKKNPISEDTYLAVLVRSYAGGPQEAQLEEFLVRAAPEFQEGGFLPHGVADSLYRTYFYAGERSQYAGLIEDARRAYGRFLYLGRMLNRRTGLGIDMHLHLSRANARLKVLAPEHAFATEAMEAIQDGPAEDTKRFIDHPYPRLAALARYNAASFLWRKEEVDAAVSLLKGPGTDCGVLRVECGFLLAKILDSEGDSALAREAAAILDDLIRTLPDRDPLLDDLYFHRALVASQRRDKQRGHAALRELQHRCPDTDLLAEIESLNDELSARVPMEAFDE